LKLQGADGEEDALADMSPGEQRAEALMQQAAVAWNVRQDQAAAEKLQRAALEAVGEGRGRPEIVAQVGGWGCDWRGGGADDVMMSFAEVDQWVSRGEERGTCQKKCVCLKKQQPTPQIQAAPRAVQTTRARDSRTATRTPPSHTPITPGGVVPRRHAVRAAEV